MSLPPPALPPATASVPVAGWYADPWDPRGQRWWDGSAWSAYTDAHYGVHRPAVAPAATTLVSELVGPTRWLRLVLPLGVAMQTAGLILSWSSFRDLFRHLRDNDLATLGSNPVSGAATLGQVLSMASIVVLVLRMVWLHRATAAAAAAGPARGGVPRRSPGLACCGWLIPIVNLWWPFQGMHDVCPGDAGTRRLIGWWWATYLIGALGGTVALIATVAASAAVAAAVIAVPSLSVVVSAFLERRLVVLALHEQAGRVGLDLGDSGPTDA